MGNTTGMKSEEQKQLEKAYRRVKSANNFRLFFLFIALFLVLYLFYGNKFASEAAWFVNSQLTIYNILFFDVLIMLASSIVKLFLTASYNKKVKEQKKM